MPMFASAVRNMTAVMLGLAPDSGRVGMIAARQRMQPGTDRAEQRLHGENQRGDDEL